MDAAAPAWNKPTAAGNRDSNGQATGKTKEWMSVRHT